MATTGQKLLAAGPTLAAAEIGLAIAHTGFIGAVVGAAIAAVVYVAVEETVSGENENSSLDDSQETTSTADHQPKEPMTEKTPSLLYRMLNGKSTREALAINEGNENDDVDTEPLDEQSVFPQYPHNERLSLGYLTKVGTLARFDPHMDMLLGKGLIVSGIQGSGKSNVAALVLESAGRCRMSAVMFDYKREYHTVVAVLPNGIRAGHASLKESAGPGYFVLNKETAPEFARLVMTDGYQAIVDLPSYGESLDEQGKIITAVLNALMSWSKAQDEDGCLPCLVMLDEAHWFLPQRVELAPTLEKDTFNSMQSAFYGICNQGRSFGYTMCFFTQRIKNMQKWAIANCQTKVVMKHTEKNDLNECEQEVEKEVATRQEIANLADGTGVVIGFTHPAMIVHFDRRESKHVSNTPKIARSHTAFKPLQEQRVIRQQPVLSASPFSDVPEKGAPALVQKTEDKNGKAIAIWESLVERNEAKLRPFAEAMELKETKAYELLTELADAGLIEWERRKVKA